MSRKILVTGCAGFVGHHLARRLVDEGWTVIGLDNFNDYYDVRLKRARVAELESSLPAGRYQCLELDICDGPGLNRLFEAHSFAEVIHLAAQAGVRYSLTNPKAYIESNLAGFLNILESCRNFKIRHLLYASSSSVYGANAKQPFSEADPVDHPVSLYAATKRSNELMAHTYSHLFGLPTTGLRFFTVYGPWGRPDMAYWKFTESIFSGKPIDVFNFGKNSRDFTYIDDITSAIAKLIHLVPGPNPGWDGRTANPGLSSAPFRIFNVGNHEPIEVSRFIRILEELIGKKAQLRELPRQPGDVDVTYADVEALKNAVGFAPSTRLEDGLARFVSWYRDFHLNG